MQTRSARLLLNTLAFPGDSPSPTFVAQSVLLPSPQPPASESGSHPASCQDGLLSPTSAPLLPATFLAMEGQCLPPAPRNGHRARVKRCHLHGHKRPPLKSLSPRRGRGRERMFPAGTIPAGTVGCAGGCFTWEPGSSGGNLTRWSGQKFSSHSGRSARPDGVGGGFRHDHLARTRVLHSAEFARAGMVPGPEGHLPLAFAIHGLWALYQCQ